ncbi:hypothetical protein H0H81_006960 [Sphagnurus paluster]|uniref:Uncharacterized protein n=1 Tax=Sphagnurus paluster TaxID=117069 RepID=A0A9P7GJR5_9AGAR|nr:hypothetical protein H0H81_006960 [Sphagnurus paluster]
MVFTLGSIIVKGGKVVSSGFNHQRPHYDESFSRSAADRPVSMHAEMHAIFSVSGGQVPPSKQYLQASFLQWIKQPPEELGPELPFLITDHFKWSTKIPSNEDLPAQYASNL